MVRGSATSAGGGRLGPRRRGPGARAGAGRPGAASAARAAAPCVWVETSRQEVLTAAVEAGFRQFLFPDSVAGRERAAAWREVAAFEPLYHAGDAVQDGAAVVDADGQGRGRFLQLRDPGDLPSLMEAVEAAAAGGRGGEAAAEAIVLDFPAADGWKVIPAENLVAAKGGLTPASGSGPTLLARSGSAAGARLMLEALEAGTDGVVLATEDAGEVLDLRAYLREQESSAAGLGLTEAVVEAVEQLGMGDRCCVDLCSALHPGEGLLVGSFSRALFLVHSECADSQYINSRPFRVNAGPVHAYVQGLEGRTSYLSELKAGSSVLVVDAAGRTRQALVGRVKIEQRPLTLVRARSVAHADEDDGEVSCILQNAETVKLVARTEKGGEEGWEAVPVNALREGQRVVLYETPGGRHTGLSVEEQISER